MTILVSSTVPGLLGALEQAMGGSQELLVVRDAERLLGIISSPDAQFTALILSDTIEPRPHQEVAQSLWEIVAYMSRHRRPPAPVLLTLARETPAVIQDALQAEVRKTGGDVCLLSHRARTPSHPEAQQAVAWIIAQLSLTPPHGQQVIVPATAAGGSRKSTSMLNLCIYLRSRGLRVLLVDVDIAQGALLTSLRVSNEPLEFYTTLPGEYPDLVTTYPTELVRRRIYHHHPSGLDVLFAGHGIRDQLDMEPRHLDGLIDTLSQLDYDVVCYDVPGDWKRRNVIVSLFARGNTSPFVICPPGRKERMGALAALDVLGKIGREDGRTALEAAMVLFAEGERGMAVTIREVRRDVLRQYPMLTDLGTLPHDTALISMVAERQEFCSVFDLAPRRAYCTAVRKAARRWMEAVALPPAWLTNSDPYGRSARSFWPFGRRPAAHANRRSAS